MSDALQPISSVDAAREFLAIGGDMSSMKLQKLVYLAHENHIGETGKPLISDDVVEAWSEGPVLERLARLIGNSDDGKITAEDLPEGETVADAEVREYFQPICELFKNRSGRDLSEITHMWGSPWRMARRTVRRGGFLEWLFGSANAEKPVISDCMIRHHFQSS